MMVHMPMNLFANELAHKYPNKYEGRKLMAVKDNSEEWFTQHIDKLTDDKWCIDMCQPEAEKYDPNCEDFCVGYVDYDFVACTQPAWNS